MANIFDVAAKKDKQAKETVTEALSQSSAPTEALLLQSAKSLNNDPNRYGGRRRIMFGIDPDIDSAFGRYKGETGKTISDVINEAIRLLLKDKYGNNY